MPSLNRSEVEIKVGHLQSLVSSRGWKVLVEILDQEYKILDNRTHQLLPELSQVVYSVKDMDFAKMMMIDRVKKIPDSYINSNTQKKRSNDE